MLKNNSNNDSSPLLIADAGGTSTKWALIRGSHVGSYVTAGINPVVMDSATIGRIIMELNEMIPVVPCSVRFYGAGCRDRESSEKVGYSMQRLWGDVEIHISSDLVGAAVALFGTKPGIACILGTGSNSGVYNGSEIVANTPPMGYILGDEGSGAAIGKAFLNAIFKGRFSVGTTKRAKETMKMSLGEVIESVYRKPMANSFLASFCPAVHSMLDCEEVEELVVEQFRRFYESNIVPYGSVASGLSVGFVGSVAAHFERQLRKAIPLPVASVIADPLPAMVEKLSQATRF